MRSVLALETLGDRIEKYAILRANGIAPNPENRVIRLEAGVMMREVALRGELSRGEAIRRSGLRSRKGRDVLKELLDDGLLSSGSAKGPVRPAFPTHAAPYLFPDLYPEGVAETAITAA